ncbi:MAG: hypothetical protein OEZ02_07365 [Anaerolineae bacterium]|nr:hypothetical protein [Anaerolineae bacterium]
MTSDHEYARGLLVRGIAAAKADEINSAQHFLERVLHAPASHIQHLDALYWLSKINQDPVQKRSLLEDILASDPAHHRARRQLAILDGKLDPDDIINPDQYQNAASDEPIAASSERFVCTTCGGRKIFSPDGSELVCEYCQQSHNTPGGGKGIEEQNFIVGIATAKGHSQAVDMRSLECHGCGVIFLIQPKTISISCPHCDSVYAIDHTDMRKLVPPEGIIPFSVNKEIAVRNISQWLKNIKAKSNPSLRGMNGVYLPVWTFDIGGQLPYSYVFQESQQQFRKEGIELVYFDDLPIPANTPRFKKYSELVNSFVLQDVQPYEPKFLANWPAETYQITLASAALEARRLAISQLKNQIKRNLPDNAQLLKIDTTKFFIETYKLILVPVWIGLVSMGNLQQEVLVSGQSGMVYGEHPQPSLTKLMNWLTGK